MEVTKKRLFWDIETSLNIGAFWRSTWKANISHDQIIHEREVICICYKWEGEDEVHSLDWSKGEYRMLEKFIEILNSADESIAHNGDRFDLPWIRGRCLFHRLPMFPEYTTVDTLKWVKGKTGFGFNSNRLDYIGKFLGIGGKQDTNFGMWMDLTIDRFMHPVETAKKALDDMIAYCKEDVLLLERVFHEIQSYKKHVFNYAAKEDPSDPDSKWRCPECGGHDVRCNKTITTAKGYIRRDMMCKNKDCNVRSYRISNSAYRTYLQWKSDEAQRLRD